MTPSANNPAHLK